jgi:Fur family ferric uptake transcriptional regulator
MTGLEQLAKTLKHHGCSTTKQRLAVFSALQDQEPLNMHQVVARCTSTDRASVYRTIGLFERLGIVQRLQTGWKYKLELSDTFHIHHHHATCLGCGITLTLSEDTQLEKQLQQIAAAQQFTLQSHQLELHGYCARCTLKS